MLGTPSEETEIKNGILIIQGKTKFSDLITFYGTKKRVSRQSDPPITIPFLVTPKIQGSVSTQVPKKYKTRTKEFGGEIFA